ncbi:hypothetical protein FPY71_12565 [Aureimonas fodinaquatilis]|uniref:Uncharacterized protein n=1 Tax=Aureimonas fodinaquatilis TaxID=2565783 RepID=A0A5B0DUC7_9HYPH|nr:hypothetical protein [Aureimonas fodinaquatilis]KAA0969381.1 hypothetical protein FPY71_12565 [Aureimonas fodinaquatilis]
MADRRRRMLNSFQAGYLKSELESGSAIRSKQALQQLCKMFRMGVALQQDDRISMEIAILGVLSSAASDEKIRRWALSALTYVGRKEVSRNAVLRAISDYPDEPQVLAAAIATLFKFDGNAAQKVITHHGACTAEMIALSALQTTDPKQLDLSNLNVNIENAEPVPLKLALLLVGLDRSPENIFDPRHSNAEIVRVLGAHHEPIVSQYSVWAAAENPHLGAANIGIDLRDLYGQEPNVRSYVYRLFAEESAVSSQRHEIIVQGSKDSDKEARSGLAIGLRDNFYDGLESVTVDWFHEEDDHDIGAHVLDHIIAQAEKVPTYEKIAIDHYEFAAGDLKKRFRMEAAAAGTKIYSAFKRKSIELEAGLFGLVGGNVTNNNSFINNGTMQGAVSQSGQAVNHGEMQAALTQGQILESRKLLDRVVAEIDTVPLSDEIKGEVRQAVVHAKGQTDNETLSTVVGVLEKAEKGLKAVSGMADHANKVGTLVLGLSGFL